MSFPRVVLGAAPPTVEEGNWLLKGLVGLSQQRKRTSAAGDGADVGSPQGDLLSPVVGALGWSISSTKRFVLKMSKVTQI